MAFGYTTEEYRSAANQRLADAHELMESPTRDAKRSDVGYRHYRGAMYLAGYAIECLLKAYLIDHNSVPTPDKPNLSGAMDRINILRQKDGLLPAKDITRSATGHDISYLLSLTNLDEIAGYDKKLWGSVGTWDTSWRYESSMIRAVAAKEFMADVDAVVKWLKPKIGG